MIPTCNNAAGDNGGGIFLWGNAAELIITNCVVNGNSAVGGGGGIRANSVIVNKCKISGNFAAKGGGGIYCGVATITDCIISGNHSWRGEGAVGVGSSATISNCTIVGNSSLAVYGRSSAVTVTNSILYYNCRESRCECGDYGQIYVGSAVVTYSDVSYEHYPDYGPWPGIGNIEVDPCFVQPGYWDSNGTSYYDDDFWVDGDYHLLPDSPCINAGDPNYLVEPNETDLDGLPRVIGGRIDMGAYEFNHRPVAEAGPNQVVYADHTGLAEITLDGSASYDEDGQDLTYKWSWTIDGNTFIISKCPDGIVNMRDFAAFAEQWPESENPFADLSILADAWLSTPASPNWDRRCDIAPAGAVLTIELPVGEHTIELIVSDGIDESEPDYVDVNVVAPLKHSCA